MQAFAAAFGLSPETGVTEQALAEAFCDSIQVACVDQYGGLTFEEFWECLLRLALSVNEVGEAPAVRGKGGSGAARGRGGSAPFGKAGSAAAPSPSQPQGRKQPAEEAAMQERNLNSVLGLMKGAAASSTRGPSLGLGAAGSREAHTAATIRWERVL